MRLRQLGSWPATAGQPDRFRAYELANVVLYARANRSLAGDQDRRVCVFRAVKRNEVTFCCSTDATSINSIRSKALPQPLIVTRS